MTLCPQLSAFYPPENSSTRQHAHEASFSCLGNLGDLLSMPIGQRNVLLNYMCHTEYCNIKWSFKKYCHNHYSFLTATLGKIYLFIYVCCPSHYKVTLGGLQYQNKIINVFTIQIIAMKPRDKFAFKRKCFAAQRSFR